MLHCYITTDICLWLNPKLQFSMNAEDFSFCNATYSKSIYPIPSVGENRITYAEFWHVRAHTHRCSPKHAYSEVNPIQLNKVYSQETDYRIAALQPYSTYYGLLQQQNECSAAIKCPVWTSGCGQASCSRLKLCTSAAAEPRLCLFLEAGACAYC